MQTLARARRGPAVSSISATSRSRSAPRRPTSPRARSTRPRPSSRSSRAPATRPSSPGRSAAPPSAPPTTSRASRPSLNGGSTRPDLHRGHLRDGFVAPGLKLAAFPEHRLIHRRKAARPADAQRPRPAALASPTCAPATSSSTRTTASRASPASTPRPSPASRATTSTSSTRATTRSSCRSTSWRRSRRYVGADGAHPPLSKLGGTRWDTLKARARRAAQELAGELLNLYAERKRRRGHAFPEFSEELRDIEAAFPFRETPDQRDAIDAVMGDMESERPMDRLICGDVGYGKTEVALRAAVKAAADGKQVMMLVPTTILAQQHYGTFVERLRDQPFMIEQVSRFRPAAEQRDGGQALHARARSTS